MTNESQEALMEQLRSDGYRLGMSGGWHRAVSDGPSRQIVDIAPHPITNPRTFDLLLLDEPAQVFSIEGHALATIGLHDLVRLKLVAQRDQDLVDLTALASSCIVSAKTVARAAARDDSERAVSRGANLARHALDSSTLALVYEETLGQAITEEATRSIRVFLQQLEAEGL